MKFTILGASGFIGGHLDAYLRSLGHEVYSPPRGNQEIFNRRLGHVVYAIGLTGDFRNRLFDTVDAHVVNLMELLRQARFDSLLYLSSTRVYGGLSKDELAHEEITLPLRPSADGVYDLSKLLGESLCLAHSNERVKVARLSNVFGVGQSKHLFLVQLFHQLAIEDTLIINEGPNSGKDYIAVEDVVRSLTHIIMTGRHRVYNVASSHVLTHASLAERLSSITGRKIIFRPDAPVRRFPQIVTSRLQREFPFTPRRLEDELSRLIVAVNASLGSNFHEQETN